VVSLSHDGGATWTQVASGAGTDPTALPNSDRSLSWIQFDVTDPNTVYVASVAPEASVNHLWKSTDFGAHWTAVTGAGLPEGIPVDLIKSDPKPLANQPDKVLYAGTHLGIYRSVDGGATWTRFGAGMPLVEVTDLYISSDETLVRAATYGRGFWELGGPADDFSITANPTSLTVAPGANGTVTLDTAITSGAAQSIALAASGLPAGTTATFTPPTVNAGTSSTLTLATTGTTPVGSATVTVTGTTGVNMHTATITLDVESPAGGGDAGSGGGGETGGGGGGCGCSSTSSLAGTSGNGVVLLGALLAATRRRRRSR
jgi:MYXO-CTERM domain-containing protein